MSLKNFPSFLLNFSEGDMHGENGHSYEFRSFRLDLAERQLLNNKTSVPLTPKAFDVLAILVEKSGHLVEKDELMHAVWPDSFVEEANISRIIHTLRNALGEDDDDQNKFIETVPTKGYRFVAKITKINHDQGQDMSPTRSSESNGKNVFPAALPQSRRTESGAHVIVNLAEWRTLEKQAETETETEPSTASLEFAPAPAAEPKHRTRIILFTVGFLSAIFLIVLLSFNFQSAPSTGLNNVKSIAVMPLKPLTAENREPIYELGIAESLIFKLSMAKGLVVRPLSATRQYTDVQQDAIAAGREQQVDYVLASNYQILGGKIRITSQLINVQSGLVEEVFKDERENSSGFAVQDAVAANIGQSLLKKLNLEPNNLSAKRDTTNEEAYRVYLQGTALADKRNRTDVEKAIEYFEQAVRLDPNYALAYAGLANAHTAMALEGGGNPREQYPKAKAAIEKALAIDDNLAEAHSYAGEINFVFEWDFAGAEAQHKRAIELNPNSSPAHRMYALLLNQPLGRFDESIAEIKTAIDLEPASVLNHKIYGQSLYYARRYDEAVVELKRTVEMDAEFSTVHKFLINSYRLKGEEAQAFEWFVRQRTQFGDKPDEIQSWKTIYAKSGWRGVFERQLEQAKEAEKNGKPNYMQLALHSIELGERDAAFAYLEKAFGERKWAMTTLKVEPRFDTLRSDPRFEDLVRRVGLN